MCCLWIRNHHGINGGSKEEWSPVARDINAPLSLILLFSSPWIFSRCDTLTGSYSLPLPLAIKIGKLVSGFWQCLLRDDFMIVHLHWVKAAKVWMGTTRQIYTDSTVPLSNPRASPKFALVQRRFLLSVDCTVICAAYSLLWINKTFLLRVAYAAKRHLFVMRVLFSELFTGIWELSNSNLFILGRDSGLVCLL